MAVIYVDTVFFLNGILDYLLLLCTARLAGIPLRRGRYLLAALAGGVYAVAAVLPGLACLGSGAVKMAAGVLLALIAFGGEVRLFRLTALFMALSCGLAGCILGLSLLAGSRLLGAEGVFFTNVDVKGLLLAGTAVYLFFSAVFRAAARHSLNGETAEVKISICGRTVSLTALLDNGCGVCEPVSGQPVLVVAEGALDSAFPTAVRRQLTREALQLPAELLEPLRQAAPELRFFLVPYRAVGVNGGLLLTVRSDWVSVAGQKHPGLPVGLAPGELGEGYHALWGGKWRKEDGHAWIGHKTAADTDPYGNHFSG